MATHSLAAPRVAIVHNWQNTQNDGWYRSAFDGLKIPYTYVADTKLRETANLREQFDVILLPPMGGNLSSMIRGLPMRGEPRPWKNSPAGTKGNAVPFRIGSISSAMIFVLT